MKTNTGKGLVILRVVGAMLVFAVFRQITSLFGIVNAFVEKGWSLLQIINGVVLLQMIFTGTAVLIILPVILRVPKWRDWLPGYFRTDRKTVLLGLFSFVIFGALATGISLGMGIFKGDLSTVFAYPDIDPDPDVIGWGYFLMALVPGIWEELAFRGLIQSKLRKAFSTTTAVLLSSLFFALFHFSNLLTQAPAQVVSGVIMAFFFGIGWGFMTVRTGSVVPAMLSHYLVDSIGLIFLGVDSTDPALSTGFYLLLTLLFPVSKMVLGGGSRFCKDKADAMTPV